MPRRGQIAKRDVLPDPVYNSKLVTRLINNIMYDGKKGVSQKIVYGAFDIISEKTGKEPLEVFISMLVKQQQQNVSFSTPVSTIKSARLMMALLLWTGWYRSRKEVLQLHLLLLLASGAEATTIRVSTESIS